MTELYLSRARLMVDHGEALSAIAPVLLPDNPSQRVGLAHRLVWLLFQDIPNATRDFIWREEGDGRYLILSPRAPTNRNGLFELETKSFKPHLERGDELRFQLRANPTVARKSALTEETRKSRTRGKRVDVVMDLLSKEPKDQRAKKRDDCIQHAGRQWMDEQGSRNGFTVVSVEATGYLPTDVSDRERKGRRNQATISLLDFAGMLRVEDPPAFLSKVAKGFGSAKAFGCGLMLIRRL